MEPHFARSRPRPRSAARSLGLLVIGFLAGQLGGSAAGGPPPDVADSRPVPSLVSRVACGPAGGTALLRPALRETRGTLWLPHGSIARAPRENVPRTIWRPAGSTAIWRATSLERSRFRPEERLLLAIR